MSSPHFPQHGDDGYIRLRLTGPLLVSEVPGSNDALVFIDLDCASLDVARAHTLLARLREVPHEMFLRVRTLVVRVPEPSQWDRVSKEDASRLQTEVATELERLNEDLGIHAQFVGAVSFGPCSAGADGVRVDGVSAIWRNGRAPVDEAAAVARARQAEIVTLLRRGNAVWRPDTYHYVLPSGRHAAAFVRLADAIREPRDAQALATWLLSEVVPGSALLLDNASLTPLVVALHAQQRAHDLHPSTVTCLTSYPSTQFDVDRAVRSCAGLHTPVHVLMTVTSSGALLDRVISAVERAAQNRWRIDVLVGRGRSGALTTLQDGETGGRLAARPANSVDVWSGLEDTSASAGERCSLCSDPRRARVVHIDPRSHEGVLLPEAQLMVPSVTKALDSRRLWELADATGAAKVQSEPDLRTRRLRPKRRGSPVMMGARMDLDVLVTSKGLPAAVRDRLVEPIGDTASFVTQIKPSGANVHPEPDLLVVSTHDSARPGSSGVFDVVAAALGIGRQVVVDPDVDDPEWAEQARAAIQASDHPVLFTLGSVSGYTLQRMLVGVQELQRNHPRPYELSGLVLHCRPATARARQTLVNSFSHRLWYLWETLLPEWSPLDEEAVLLDQLSDPHPDPKVNEYLELRREICQGQFAAVSAVAVAGREGDASSDPDSAPSRYVPLLWGLPSEPADRTRIRQQSIFGHRLGPESLHLAVAAALQTTRDPDGRAGAPQWRLFEMPAILRAYYDPLILASILRWIGPGECWWGSQPDEADKAVGQILSRATDDDLKLLLPELIVAAAQSKLPQSAALMVIAHTEAVLREPYREWEEDERIPLLAGLQLWRGLRVSTAPRTPDGAAGELNPEGTAERTLEALSRSVVGLESLLGMLSHVPASVTLDILNRPSELLGSSVLEALVSGDSSFGQEVLIEAVEGLLG